MANVKMRNTVCNPTANYAHTTNRIGDPAAKHLYEVELLYNTERSKIEVSANTRAQAADKYNELMKGESK